MKVSVSMYLDRHHTECKSEELTLLSRLLANMVTVKSSPVNDNAEADQAKAQTESSGTIGRDTQVYQRQNLPLPGVL